MSKLGSCQDTTLAKSCCKGHKGLEGRRKPRTLPLGLEEGTDVTVSPLFLSFRVAQTPSPGPSASASAQDCSRLCITCMAWRWSTATSRGKQWARPHWGLGCKERQHTGLGPLPLHLPRFGFLSHLTSFGSLLSYTLKNQCSLVVLCLCCQHELPTCHHIHLSELVFSQQAPHTSDVFHFPPSSCSGPGPWALGHVCQTPQDLEGLLREGAPYLYICWQKQLVWVRLPAG